MKVRARIAAVVFLITGAFIAGSVGAVALRNSATVKFSCNTDGTVNIETVPLNYQ